MLHVRNQCALIVLRLSTHKDVVKMADDAEKVAQTIKEHDDLLCAPDAVLSPDIFEACTSAVKLKNVDGSPAFRVKDVINKLSSGYVGYAYTFELEFVRAGQFTAFTRCTLLGVLKLCEWHHRITCQQYCGTA